MNQELKRIRTLFSRLLASKSSSFTLPDIKKVSSEQGNYIIYYKRRLPVHVGRTVRGKRGLHQRLLNHYRGTSSFVRSYLHHNHKILRRDYSFKIIVVRDDRTRALLEAYAIGMLCPKHIGLGKK